MVEEILFESERHLDRSAVASYLRTVADRLDDGDAISLESGDQSVTVSTPPTVEFEVKVEREGPADGSGEIGFEMELEWDEDSSQQAGDGQLSIE